MDHLDGKAGFLMDESKEINRLDDDEAFAEETVEMPEGEQDESPLDKPLEEPDGEPGEEPDGETAEPEAGDAEEGDSEEETGPDAEAGAEEEAGPDAEAGAEETAEEEDGAADKGGPFRRKEKKDKKDEQIEELNDRYRRQLAEFENFRKRTEKEKSQMFETGAKSVIEKMLPVVDNLERGLDSIPEDERDGPVAEGMEKIYRQMMSVLDEIGVKPIETEGAEFDPNLHNAVMHVEDKNLGENMVAEELQKGYTYRDSVVRHSMVKVAN